MNGLVCVCVKEEEKEKEKEREHERARERERKEREGEREREKCKVAVANVVGLKMKWNVYGYVIVTYRGRKKGGYRRIYLMFYMIMKMWLCCSGIYGLYITGTRFFRNYIFLFWPGGGMSMVCSVQEYCLWNNRKTNVECIYSYYLRCKNGTNHE